MQEDPNLYSRMLYCLSYVPPPHAFIPEVTLSYFLNCIIRWFWVPVMYFKLYVMLYLVICIIYSNCNNFFPTWSLYIQVGIYISSASDEKGGSRSTIFPPLQNNIHTLLMLYNTYYWQLEKEKKRKNSLYYHYLWYFEWHINVYVIDYSEFSLW